MPTVTFNLDRREYDDKEWAAILNAFGNPIWDEQSLAKAHWEYVKSVLEAHGEEEEIINLIGFHYVEAFKRGYKHGREDCELYRGGD